MLAAQPKTATGYCQWEHCGAWFAEATALHDHVLSVHIGSARDGQSVCLQCKWQDCNEALSGKVFRRRYSITSHILVHVPLYQFYCNLCGRGFKRKPDLNKHAPVCKKVGVADEENEALAWTKEAVAAWLGTVGLGEFEELFLENDIDGPLLLKLGHNFLKAEMGIKSAGKRESILSAVDEMRRQSAMGQAMLLAGGPLADCSVRSPGSSTTTLLTPQLFDGTAVTDMNGVGQVPIDPLTATDLLGPGAAVALPDAMGPLQALIDCQLQQHSQDETLLDTLDLMEPFADFDFTFAEDAKEDSPAPSVDSTASTRSTATADEKVTSPDSDSHARVGQVKRAADEVEGSRKRPEHTAAEFFSEMAVVMSKTGKPLNEGDVSTMLDGYTPDKMQELAATLGRLAQVVSQQIAKQAGASNWAPLLALLPAVGPCVPPAAAFAANPIVMASAAAKPGNKRLARQGRSRYSHQKPQQVPLELPQLQTQLAPPLQWAWGTVPTAPLWPQPDILPMVPVADPKPAPNPAIAVFKGTVGTQGHGARPAAKVPGTSSFFAGGLQKGLRGEAQKPSAECTGQALISAPRMEDTVGAERGRSSGGLIFHHYRPQPAAACIAPATSFKPALMPKIMVPAFTTPVVKMGQLPSPLQVDSGEDGSESGHSSDESDESTTQQRADPHIPFEVEDILQAAAVVGTVQEEQPPKGMQLPIPVSDHEEEGEALSSDSGGGAEATDVDKEASAKTDGKEEQSDAKVPRWVGVRRSCTYQGFLETLWGMWRSKAAPPASSTSELEDGMAGMVLKDSSPSRPAAACNAHKRLSTLCSQYTVLHRLHGLVECHMQHCMRNCTMADDTANDSRP